MQGIYTYIPETNYVPREYNVAAILLLLFMVLISLVPVLNPLYSYIAIHITPYHFSYFLFCPSPSMFYICMFHCILGLVALTVSEWSALSCLVAVTFLSLKSTRFPATPYVFIPGFQVILSSSYVCNGVRPLVNPFRSNVSRSLFRGLPRFLLPFGE
jgi:hypothetical protein